MGFYCEKNWGVNSIVKRHLAERIQGLKAGNGEPMVKPQDKVVFMCTQVDRRETQVPFLSTGYPDIDRLHYDIGSEYQIAQGRQGTGIFSAYENTHPISRLWRPHNYLFIPFSAGTFNTASNGKEYFNPGSDYYPTILWEAICK